MITQLAEHMSASHTPTASFGDMVRNGFSCINSGWYSRIARIASSFSPDRTCSAMADWTDAVMLAGTTISNLQRGP